MELHRSRYGIGRDSRQDGRWYVWAGTRLLGFADLNTEKSTPKWRVWAQATPRIKACEIPGGARSVDEAIRILGTGKG